MHDAHNCSRSALKAGADDDDATRTTFGDLCLAIAMIFAFGWGNGLNTSVNAAGAKNNASLVDDSAVVTVRVDTSGSGVRFDDTGDTFVPITVLTSKLRERLIAERARRVNIVLEHDLPSSALLAIIETLRSATAGVEAPVHYTVGLSADSTRR